MWSGLLRDPSWADCTIVMGGIRGNEVFRRDMSFWKGQGYNQRRPHQGRGMNGRTPAKAFTDGLPKTTPAKPRKEKPKASIQAAA